MVKPERDKLRLRVVRGIRHDRYSKDGDAAYKEAVENFTPRQLGALHRTIREVTEDMERIDLENQW